MFFNKLLGTEEALEGAKNIRHRTAVRAVFLRKNQILLVRSDQGYYKLPGGGVEEGESFNDALLREVAEETGYINCAVKSEIGTVTETRMDQFVEDATFQMVSRHYLCELINDKKNSQQLDDYEQEQGFTAVWVDIDQAIRENQVSLLNYGDQTFLHRENFVLGEVKRSEGIFPSIENDN